MKRTGFALFLGAIGLFAAIGPGLGSVWAQPAGQAPRPLAALVPSSVGLCVESQHLAQHLDEFRGSDLYQRFRKYPPVTVWAMQHGSKLVQLSEQLQRRLGVSLEDLATRLLGERFLVAVWPPESDNANAPGLLLLETAEAELLKQLLDRLVDAQRADGKFADTLQLDHGQQVYTVYVLAPDKTGNKIYLAAIGNLGLLTTSQRVLDQVLQLHAGVAGDEVSLAVLPAYQESRQRLSPEAVATAFINPRSWDARIAAGVDAALAEQKPGKQMLLDIWKATRYAAAGIDLAERLSVECSIACDRDGLPESMRQIAASFSGPSEFVQQIPRDAMVAVAGRFDVAGLLPHLDPQRQGANDAAHQPQPLGPLIALTLLGGLGPEAGSYLVPAAHSPQGPGSFPVDWVVGLGTRPLALGEPDFAESLDPLVRTAMTIAATAYNARQKEPSAVVESTEVDGVRITSLAGIQQLGSLSANFTSLDGWLWGGTSARAVTRAVGLTGGDSLIQDQRFRSLLSPRVGAPSQLLYVDLAALRQTMLENPSAADFLSSLKGIDQQKARQSWRLLVTLLQVADKFLLEAHCDEDGFAFAAGLSIDEPDEE